MNRVIMAAAVYNSKALTAKCVTNTTIVRLKVK